MSMARCFGHGDGPVAALPDRDPGAIIGGRETRGDEEQ